MYKRVCTAFFWISEIFKGAEEQHQFQGKIVSGEAAETGIQTLDKPLMLETEPTKETRGMECLLHIFQDFSVSVNKGMEDVFIIISISVL